jgi:hypothetical protein
MVNLRTVISFLLNTVWGWVAAPLALLVLAVVTGFAQAILRWPWYSKVLAVVALIWLAGAVIRYRKPLWTGFRGALRQRGEPGGISQTFLRAENSSDIRAWNNTMRVQTEPSAPPVPIIDLTSDPEIKRECTDLSQKLFVLYAIYETAERSRMMTFRSRQMQPGTTESEKQKLRDAEDLESHKNNAELMARYNGEFIGVALALAERLEARRWLTQEDRFAFQPPPMPLSIQAVATTLARLGARP